MTQPDRETPAKAFGVALVRHVADTLRNTPAVCRSCYIHPSVLEAVSDESQRHTLPKSLNGAVSDEGWEDVLRRFLRKVPA